MNIASVIKGLASLVWLVTIGLIVLAVVGASRAKPIKNAKAYIIGAIVAALVFTIVGAGLVFVEPSERGVVISPYSFRAPNGYLPEPLLPGLCWIVPGERVTLYTISRQTYTMSAVVGEGQAVGDDSIRARTNDGQEVFIDASVIYSIDPDKVVQLNIDWQNRYQTEVVRPLSRGIIRDMASQYGVEEIVSSKRTELEKSISTEMMQKLSENDLILVDFVLRDIHFSEEYAAAVEQKQIAEQLALQAQFIVEQRRQEAEQARQVAEGQGDAILIEAEAKAQALVLLAQALKNHPELLTYEYIQKIASNIQVMLVPSDNPYILPLPNP